MKQGIHMAKASLQSLGRRLVEQRGDRGVREVAQEIGISPSTLSRIERGNLPNLETFGKVCEWLGVDPGPILGVKSGEDAPDRALVRFRKDRAVSPATAKALADMILAAQRALAVSEGADHEHEADDDRE